MLPIRMYVRAYIRTYTHIHAQTHNTHRSEATSIDVQSSKSQALCEYYTHGN